MMKKKMRISIIIIKSKAYEWIVINDWYAS